MDSPILKEITKFLHERKKQRRNTILFACAALVVVAGTAAALRMIGQAMTRKEKVLVCALEVHEHDKKDCYDDDGNLICGLADYVVHVHNDDCYDATGELVCTLPEIEPHEHTDECYEEEEVLVCTEEESDGHVHTDECYETVQGEEPVCGMEEHQHDDGCYDEEGNLACDLEEHEHSDDCYEKEEVLACGKEEGDGGHTHTDACYEKQKVLACGKLELHTHDEKKCYEEDEDGNLILTCDIPVLEEHVHSDELGCFEIREAVTEADVEREYFSEESETEEPDSEEADGESESEKSSEEEPADVTATESGEATEGEVYTEEENASDVSATEPQTITKVCENEKYMITATYTSEAEIPEEAELYVEQVTAETDNERYADREAKYRETLGDRGASMKALFKIGFYVDGVEVEPKAPVTITVQLFDSNGLPEGEPITVVHFAEEGEEVLDGSQVKSGSTSFQMSSFSEVAIGTGINKKANGGINDFYVDVDKTGEYENDSFRMTLHIEGRAKFPEGTVIPYEGNNTGSAENKTEGNNSESGETSAETEIGGSIVEESTEEDGEASETADMEQQSEVSDEQTLFYTEEAEGDAEQQSGDVVTSAITEKQLSLEIASVDEKTTENAEDYAAVTACANELGDNDMMLDVISYSLSYEGIKLDLSDCKVTAEVEPTQSLRERAQKTVGETPEGEEVEEDLTLTFIEPQAPDDESGTGDMPEGTTEAETEDKTTESGSNSSDTTGWVVDAAAVNDIANSQVVNLNAVGAVNTMAAAVTSQANPEFTVEFYANIKKIVIDDQEGEREGFPDANGISDYRIIDTQGGVLPKNYTSPKVKWVHVKDSEFQQESAQTEIYSAGRYEYISSPGLVYFNKISKNDNYQLKQIQIYSGSQLIETYECEINGKPKEWHFTNKPETQKEYPNEFILIRSDATIRLIFDPKDHTESNGADFYDYDVSDGKIYTNKQTTSTEITDRKTDKTITSHDSKTPVWYMSTEKQGINSNLKDQTFGFGNSEGLLPTGLGRIPGNLASNNTTYHPNPDKNNPFGTTYGLVTGLSDGKLQYASNVKAPNLFNDGGNVKGKTSYSGELGFLQKGDTYTLSNAKVKEGSKVVSQVGQLEKFTLERWNYGKTRRMISNTFYPLDNVSSAGQDGHDLMFGKTEYMGGVKAFNNSGTEMNAPESDDGENHNHYFGMHFTIDFNLVKDYIGPLEYFFYGDDDLWVFLDDKLICDLGGVHSSAGEYVNLWDYIAKGSEGSHRLTFFYTERGASGSTCWMQFTLPSVTFATTKQETGELRIEKNVDNEPINKNTDEEFGFEVKFWDAQGNVLKDDYSYTKYRYVLDKEGNYTFDKDGNKVTETVPGGTDVLIWNDAKFTLKAGEYIIINFLPDGTKYKIKEVGPVTIKNPNREPGENIQWDVATENPYKPEISGGSASSGDALGERNGTISAGSSSAVQLVYNNLHKYNLPETGGPGTTNPYTIACILCVLGAGGAGFLYRKKFRERRVRRSS